LQMFFSQSLGHN